MLKKTIAIIILIIGLLLIFSPFIKNGIVKYMSGHETIEQYNASDIKKNNEKDATFDFESVQLPSMTSVIKGAANYDKDAVIGSIAVPSVDVNLLVF
ncbi:class A sortase, partial [Listeria monocytogenes]|nr:class A sortase [Listeria monocytogenes]